MPQDKLRRLSKHIVSPKETAKPNYQNTHNLKLAECLKGELCVQSNGSYVKIVSDFDETYAHGKAMIIDLKLLTPFKRDHFYESNEPELLDAENLLFFDMETTGLGGSGTVAFLIGFGSIRGNGLQVRQYFLPDYPDEEAMLEAVRSEITEDTIIVSYNGKSFDMPILTDRMIIQRVERNLAIGDHIDLLHPVRRLYRRRLRDCTLGNVEKNILDFYRHDDIPGHLVPSIYFNWLSTTDTDLLDKVAEHNLNDIISLFFIMHHISGVRERPADNISEPDDILSLARILERRREHDNLCQMLERFDDVAWGHERFDILYLQSLSYKRGGRLPEAVALWEKIAANSTLESFLAGIELAKYYEHRARDMKKALHFARCAKAICPAQDRFKDDVLKRINRLNQKLSRAHPSK